MERVDVLVIGGGLAGAAAAATLAERAPHLGTVLLETKREDEREARPLKSGEVLFAAHRRALRAVGVEPEGAPWVTHELTRFRVVTPDGREHRAETTWEKRLTEISKDDLERAMRARARAAGADVRHGVRATEAVVEDGRVVAVRARTAAKEDVELRTRWVVDAGGRFALIPRRLRLKDAPKDDNHAVVAAFYRDFPGDKDVWEIFFYEPAPSTVELSHPTPRLARLGLGVPMRTLRETGMTAEAFFERRVRHQPELARRLEASGGLEYTWAVAPIAYRVYPPPLGNALLVGDARGYLSPFFGDGNLIALTTGREAAERVAAEAAGGPNAAEAHREALARQFRWERWRAEALRVFLYPRLVSAGFRTPVWRWMLERQIR